MATYTCKRCGNSFYAKAPSNYCSDCRNRVTKCVICGKEFKQKDPSRDTKTCSRACAGKYRSSTGISKRATAKSLVTKFEKYGNGSGAKYASRTCLACGKEFIPRGSKHVYCDGPHYSSCVICGKEFPVKDWPNRPRTCSEECRVVLVTKLARERDHSESQAKMKKTCLEKYGTEYYSQTSEWKDKVEVTSMKKYGAKSIMATKEFREASEAVFLKRYGCDNPAKANEVKEKILATLNDRYGGMGTGSEITRKKIEATCEERYGDAHPSRTLQCKEKMKATCRDKYGFDFYNSSKEGLKNLMMDPSKIDDFWEFRNNPEEYIPAHYSEKPYSDEVAQDLGVNETTIYDVLIRKNCKDLINRSRTSIIEREMNEFLLSLVPKEEVIWCDRRTITPYELDFYLPNYHFAIECNPTFTHNSSVSAFDDEPKSTVYHRNKTQAAEDVGVFLMHVFGYDWVYKRDIIQSMIKSVLGKSDRTIYARNTKVVELDAKTTKEFLNINHRQGDASSPIRLGLVDRETEELVSVMTFSKTRSTIGKKATDSDKSFELVRFCSLLNTSVVGGASKLFKWFVRNHNPDRVMSFSDRAHTKGNLYPTLGFQEVRKTDPGYGWVNIQTEEFKNRVACQKHKLPQLFDDVTQEDMDKKSERVIMIEHGYAQVYDSGSIVWEWTSEGNE